MAKSLSAPKPARVGPDYADGNVREQERQSRGNQYMASVLSQRRDGIGDGDEDAVNNLETLAISQAQAVDNVADSAWDAVPAVDAADPLRFGKRFGLAIATAELFDQDIGQLSAGIAAMNAKPGSSAAAWTIKGFMDHAYDARTYARAEIVQAMETRTLHGEQAEGGPSQLSIPDGKGFAGEVASIMQPTDTLVASGAAIREKAITAGDATGDRATDVAIDLSGAFDGLDVASADAGWLWLTFVDAGPSRDVYQQLGFMLAREDGVESAPDWLLMQWEAQDEAAKSAEDAAYADGFGGYTDGVTSFVNLDDAKASKRALDAQAATMALFSLPEDLQTAPAAASSSVNATSSTASSSPTAAAPGPGASSAVAGQLGKGLVPVDATKASAAQSFSRTNTVNDVVAPGDAVLDRERKATGTLKVEQGTLTGTGGMTSQTDDGNGNLRTSGGTVNASIQEGKIGGGVAGSHSAGTEKDNKGYAGNAGVVVGDAGVVITAGGARQGKTDGEAYKQSVNASVDTEKRRATFEAGSTTGDKLKEKGTTGSMTMGLDDQWNLNYFEMGAKYKTGKGGTVGGKVSFGVEVGKAVKDGTGWAIEWTETQGIGASAGKEGESGSSKYGGSAGYKGASKKGGKRLFKSKEEAEAYGNKLKSGEVPTNQTPQNADDALKLKEGETAVQSDMNGLELEGHGSYGMVSAGASVSGASVNDTKISRGTGKTVFVERAHTSMSGVAGSLGAGGVGGSVGSGSGDMDGRKIAFDLSTPAGRMAYERYAKDGTLLPMPNAWREVAREKATMESSSWGVSAPGVSFSSAGEVVDGERTGDEGKVEYSVGTRKTGLKITGWGHANASHGMEIVEANDKERYYTARSSIDNSERDDDARALGRATGGYTGHQSSGYFNGEDSRGKWNVTSVFTEDQITNGVGRAAKDHRMGDAGDYDEWSNVPKQYRGGMDGKDAMAAAMHGATPDMDLFRRGMARWVADDGLEAIQTTRDLAGFKNYRSTGGHGNDEGQTYYLDLEGDPYWTGFTGWKLGEKQAADLQQRASDNASDKHAVLAEVATLSGYYKEKMGAVAGYSEVPIHLIRQEQKRCRDLMDRLESIAGTARKTSSSIEDEAGQRSVFVPAITNGDARFDRIQALQGQLSEARRIARGAFHEANHWHGIHHLASWPGGGTPRKSKGMQHEAKAYEDADSDFERGKGLMQAAKACEELFQGATQGNDAAGAALQYIARAKGLYQRATPILASSRSSYSAIAWRNAGDIALWWDDMEKHFDAPLEF